MARKNRRNRAKKPRQSTRIRKNKLPDVGARQYEDADVANPYGRGDTNRVKRIVDPIDVLLRNKQIEKPQYQAAQHYRHAYDMLIGSIGGAMDPDKVGGGGGGSITVSEQSLYAAETMREAELILGVIDGRVVKMIVGEGRSIEETAAIFYGVVEKNGRPSARDVNKIGTRLRESLAALADRWFRAVGRDAKIRVSIVPAQDAHATAQSENFSVAAVQRET